MLLGCILNAVRDCRLGFSFLPISWCGFLFALFFHSAWHPAAPEISELTSGKAWTPVLQAGPVSLPTPQSLLKYLLHGHGNLWTQPSRLSFPLGPPSLALSSQLQSSHVQSLNSSLCSSATQKFSAWSQVFASILFPKINQLHFCQSEIYTL